MSSLLRSTGPFEFRNLRLFNWFQLFFTARFYYPVLAILFLDLGLTLDQFVILNAIWAATIFLAEVPSGALADIVGRKKLLVAAGALNILEMLVLLIAPLDGGFTLFTFCVINRILSGLSEAAASGADQALAYDTLVEHEKTHLWDDALATSMKWRSGAMLIAVVIGAAVYDPKLVNTVLSTDLTQGDTLRIPIFLCLLQAIATFIVALKFRDIETQEEKQSWTAIWNQTLTAAKWVFTTRSAMVIVLGSLVIDAIARNFATINSSYYRLISIPEFYYGFIAAAMSVIGVALPRLSKSLARKYSLITNYNITAIWVLVCLIGLIPSVKYIGVIPAILLMAALGHISFLVSRYLNEITSSKQRATVLSVKGLLFNLGYGAVSLIFSLAVVANRNTLAGKTTDLENAAFLGALAWQPAFFILTFCAFLLYYVFGKKPKPNKT